MRHSVGRLIKITQKTAPSLCFWLCLLRALREQVFLRLDLLRGSASLSYTPEDLDLNSRRCLWHKPSTTAGFCRAR